MTTEDIKTVLDAIEANMRVVEPKAGTVAEQFPTLAALSAAVAALGDGDLYRGLPSAMWQFSLTLIPTSKANDELHAPFLMALDHDCDGLAHYLDQNRLAVGPLTYRAFNRLAALRQLAPIHPSLIMRPAAVVAKAEPVADEASPDSEEPKQSKGRKKSDAEA